MRIDRIEIHNFRNFEKVAAEFSSGFNIFAGSNAQGKTNLLEAVFFCSGLRPLREVELSSLIRDGEKKSILKAEFFFDDLKYNVDIEIGRKIKNVILNGNRVNKSSDYYGKFRAVSFGPEDILLFKSSPGARRRYLDRICSVVDPLYIDFLRHYTKTLSQRNSILKDYSPSRDSELDAFSVGLVETGAQIVGRRWKICNWLFQKAPDICRSIFEGDSPDCHYSPVLNYRPDLGRFERRESDEEFLKDISEAFKKKLTEKKRVEIIRGHTLAGPHRDDLEAFLEGGALEEKASQGQLRTLAIALKIAEMRLVEEKTGSWPILLLDDIGSELDSERTAYLFHFLSEIGSQVFITTTDKKLADHFTDSESSLFEILNGSIGR